jgi:hypothetical protein
VTVTNPTPTADPSTTADPTAAGTPATPELPPVGPTSGPTPVDPTTGPADGGKDERFTITISGTTTVVPSAPSPLEDAARLFVSSLSRVAAAELDVDGGHPVSLLPAPPAAVDAMTALDDARTAVADAFAAFQTDPSPANGTKVSDALTAEDKAAKDVDDELTALLGEIKALTSGTAPAPSGVSPNAPGDGLPQPGDGHGHAAAAAAATTVAL